ncbi:ribulose-phosphate 3-epimerase [Xylocopilactobacillus apis]|uniref:Ribulose-phosphate 3-epimerase n=1 Tax=Xylocopilactobacillus apis TaxID=2932183 RepID=A0AAU9DMY7_9LACO|nr:ribulose-phosphate 3-epimerase [Xylocopilactobacillus apis]BDR57049.1 ribulose-phosphate 3-epimerase [Xylocopilactobacillus apis]
MIKIAASLHSGPKINLEKILNEFSHADIDFLHIDVMDGHFVPEIDFGEGIVKEISSFSDIPLDIHMMVENPELLINNYSLPTTEVIGIHVEATPHIHRALTTIKSLHKKAEVIINPDTPVSTIIPVLNIVDQVLVMSVDPGTSGAKFIDSTLERVNLLNELRQKNNYNYLIEADGSIDDRNIKGLIDTGLDVAVSGSFIFKDNVEKQILKLKNI